MEINPDLVPGETGNAAVDLGLTKLGTPYSQELRNQPGYFDAVLTGSTTSWVSRFSMTVPIQQLPKDVLL